MKKKDGYSTLDSVRRAAQSVLDSRAADNLKFTLQYWTKFLVGARKARPRGRPSSEAVEGQSWYIVGRLAREKGIKAASEAYSKSPETIRRYQRRYERYLRDQKST
jgi:hypothetical protein